MNPLSYLLNQSIGVFVFIPLVAFAASLLWQNKQEKPIAHIVLATKTCYIISALAYALLWFINGRTPVSQPFVTLYKTGHFVFAIQFYYDYITAIYSLVGAVLFFLISTFSRYYMHRDEGYKRFFNTILFFATGYNLIIFSGNFETLFIGWEFIGLSSFLLIAFYRNRYLPVKNAFKTLSNYRVSDVGLMLAMWLMHHLTHQNISFSQLTEAKAMGQLSSGNNNLAIGITALILLAALIKSAQFPFTAWLPRAMEGPTTSSAIFYGSLSVHIGVFVLLRTYPFWQDMAWAKAVIIFIGAITGIIATFIAKVQPTVKTQIAYSSVAQIGIIFIEVALGLHWLALLHFAGNAFLRTYQLLVSPSMLNYLVHHQYFHFHPPREKPLPAAAATLYMLGIKEWNLDYLLFTYLWSPFKWVGKKLKWLQSTTLTIVLTAKAIGIAFLSAYNPAFISLWNPLITVLMTGIALAFILLSFSYRQSALKAWIFLLVAHLFIIIGISAGTAHINAVEIVFYASGIAIAFLLGYYCLLKIKKIDNDISLNQYHGYVYEQKNTALLFLIAAIGLLGFPVTAAFIGIDIFFTYIASNQMVTIVLLALCFLFIELAAIRIYVRIFLGLHKKLNHPVAFRSS
jgi:NADH-quinone oxidoreductase subunit L